MYSTWYHTLSYPWVACTLSHWKSLEKWWGIIQPLQSSSYVGLLDPIKPACGQYKVKCSFKGSLRTLLNQHRRGLPPWSLEYPQTTPWPSHPKILRFPLVVPFSLKFKSSTKFSNKFHFNTIRVKISYLRVGPTTRLLLLAITKHNTSNSNHILQKGITRIIRNGKT
jgi:hypothetical protein